MDHYCTVRDNIRVGAITFVYSVTKRGWVFPGLSVIRNPLKAQRLAEKLQSEAGYFPAFLLSEIH
ncbi:DUF1317 family protein [Escherichia coli]|nr:DUF1317 family protein [Escherichia coli]